MNPSALPEAFVVRMQRQLGDAWPEFLEAMAVAPPTSIRGNPLKPAELPGVPVPWHPMGRYLPERPLFVADPLYHGGAYYVQEASSMLLHALLPTDIRRALDLCAAPGGKSTLLAAVLPREGLLLANEVIASRAGILAENLSRWGRAPVVVTQNDPKDFSRLEAVFDFILVDAPCSGEGMFRKDPAAMQEWSPEAVQHCAQRQQRILADAAPALAPGGALIYATCTWSEEENEAVIRHFLSSQPDFELWPAALPPEWGAMPVELSGQPQAAWRCYPHRLHGEGLFLCRLRRKGEPPVQETTERLPPPKAARNLKQVAAWLQEFARLPAGSHIEQRQEHVHVWPEAVYHFMQQQGRKLRIRQAGIHAGKLFREGIAPAHALALSEWLNPELPAVELDRELALRYLQKQDLPLAAGAPAAGYSVAHYQGITLGWLKTAGGRLKNQLPPDWRIRNETLLR